MRPESQGRAAETVLTLVRRAMDALERRDLEAGKVKGFRVYQSVEEALEAAGLVRGKRT